MRLFTLLTALLSKTQIPGRQPSAHSYHASIPVIFRVILSEELSDPLPQGTAEIITDLGVDKVYDDRAH